MRENNKGVVPRLRFPEFRDAGPWEVKPLKRMGSFVRGLTYSAHEVSEEGLLVLRSSNIQEGTLVLNKDLVFVNKTCPKEAKLRDGDIVICMSNGSKALVGKSAEFRGIYDTDITVGAFCSIFRPYINFAKLFFQTPRYAKFISVAIGGGNINNLKNSDLEEFEHPVPKLQEEQQKIANCLSSLDELIELEAKRLDAIKAHKKCLLQQLFPRESETTPRLRFPEFRDAGEWEVKRLRELVTTITPPKKIQTTDYQPSGRFPIIDQSTSDICGWTDDNAALVKGKFPVVIFGDHTCIVKLAGAPFAQGADGIKILSPTEEIDGRFLFQSLQVKPIEQKGYKRHFSTLKERLIPFAPKETGEQQKIADCLTSLDELIELQAKRLDALKAHKKGLLQQLFPQEVE